MLQSCCSKTQLLKFPSFLAPKTRDTVLNANNNLASIFAFGKTFALEFVGGPAVKNPPANPGDTGLIPGPGRSHMPWATKPMHYNY